MLGATGEAAHLSDVRRRTVNETVVETTRGRLPPPTRCLRPWPSSPWTGPCRPVRMVSYRGRGRRSGRLCAALRARQGRPAECGGRRTGLPGRPVRRHGRRGRSGQGA
ncbi:hypothetical protein [Streptomyces chattanoogensis]|uniref:hypothetical protein n=1 Tax=Streptomyces chattanoogensis TaxID=66876 RepID=UPI001FE09B99|nr:hypothetical protein [Streptomyces chattanoogensis]